MFTLYAARRINSCILDIRPIYGSAFVSMMIANMDLLKTAAHTKLFIMKHVIISKMQLQGKNISNQVKARDILKTGSSASWF